MTIFSEREFVHNNSQHTQVPLPRYSRVVYFINANAKYFKQQ